MRWEDIDWPASTIHWRAEADWKRREAVIPVPLPPPLAHELRHFQRRLGSMSGCIFTSERSATRPMDRPDTQTLLAVMAEERKVHEHHIARAAHG